MEPLLATPDEPADGEDAATSVQFMVEDRASPSPDDFPEAGRSAYATSLELSTGDIDRSHADEETVDDADDDSAAEPTSPAAESPPAAEAEPPAAEAPAEGPPAAEPPAAEASGEHPPAAQPTVQPTAPQAEAAAEEDPSPAAGAEEGAVDAGASIALPPAHRGCGFGGALCEAAVLEAIEEYLKYHGLGDTARSLGAVMAAGGVRQALRGDARSPASGPAPAAACLGGELAAFEALRHLDAGQRDAFFRVWGRIVQPEAARSATGCALELRLRVHFCTFATRAALAAASEQDVEPDFEDLKAFLAAHPAAALDESSESLAPCFALPFVPRPHRSPGLKHIFEDAWLQRLRTDVKAFAASRARVRHAPTLRHLAGGLVLAGGPQAAPPPASWHELVRIADMGLAAAARAGEEAAGGALLPEEGWRAPTKGSDPPPALLVELTDLRRRLAAVAARPLELPTAAPEAPPPSQAAPAAEATPMGIVGIAGPVSQDRLWPLSREAILRGSASLDLDGGARSPISKRLHSARSLESRARTATALLPVPPALDFGRIAGAIDGDESPAPGGGEEAPPSLRDVLRAVLRRLALPDEPIRPRRAFLAAFACFGALRAVAGRLADIAAGSRPELRELVLAVLAVCACEVVGRREIEVAEVQRPGSCIAALVAVLRREPVTSLVHMLCLAALQRLSLRAHLQAKMIELGTIDWILDNLRTVGRQLAEAQDVSGSWQETMLGAEPLAVPGAASSTPDFSVEFASALLMNLTLCPAGRKRCAELSLYEVLVCLIEHPNPQVRTHINGTLYALLGSPTIRADARERGAEATLTAAVERCAFGGDLLRRQLEYLLAQLGRSMSDGDEDQGDAVPQIGGAMHDIDDGDNFLDEEELVGHFLLAPAPGAAAGGTVVEASGAIEASAAEEALRRFRVTPAVADVQQRRFHAFIARSCKGLISPKQRPSMQQPHRGRTSPRSPMSPSLPLLPRGGSLGVTPASPMEHADSAAGPAPHAVGSGLPPMMPMASERRVRSKDSSQAAAAAVSDGAAEAAADAPPRSLPVRSFEALAGGGHVDGAKGGEARPTRAPEAEARGAKGGEAGAEAEAPQRRRPGAEPPKAGAEAGRAEAGRPEAGRPEAEAQVPQRRRQPEARRPSPREAEAERRQGGAEEPMQRRRPPEAEAEAPQRRAPVESRRRSPSVEAPRARAEGRRPSPEPPPPERGVPSAVGRAPRAPRPARAGTPPGKSGAGSPGKGRSSPAKHSARAAEGRQPQGAARPGSPREAPKGGSPSKAPPRRTSPGKSAATGGGSSSPSKLPAVGERRGSQDASTPPGASRLRSKSEAPKARAGATPQPRGEGERHVMAAEAAAAVVESVVSVGAEGHRWGKKAPRSAAVVKRSSRSLDAGFRTPATVVVEASARGPPSTSPPLLGGAPPPTKGGGTTSLPVLPKLRA